MGGELEAKGRACLECLTPRALGQKGHRAEGLRGAGEWDHARQGGLGEALHAPVSVCLCVCVCVCVCVCLGEWEL